MYIKTGKSMRVLALFMALFVVLMPVATVPVQADADPIDVSTWHDLYENLKIDGNNIRLMADLRYEESANSTEKLGIPNGVHVTLDLNGHIINRGIEGSASNEVVIDLQPGNSKTCSLTLKDSNPTRTHDPVITYEDPVTSRNVTVNGGILTGGSAGVAVRFSSADTTFTMDGGSIVGCDNVGDGGGVYLYSGKFVMNGGLIAGNKATYSYRCGGGVYCSSETTFTMNGGKITGNSANENGGGVYNGGTFLMTGGEISNNTCISAAAGYAGGVSAPFTVSGSGIVTIQGNKKGAAGSLVDSNVYLNNSTLTIGGALDSLSRIGVTAGTSTPFTSGLSGNGTISNFTSDNADYDVVLSGNEAKLQAWENVSTWAELSTKLGSSGKYRLTSDITYGTGPLTLAGSVAATLDLNGHVITGNSEQPVISMSGTSALKIIDSDPTASHVTTYSYTDENASTANVSGGIITGGKYGIRTTANSPTVTLEAGTIFGNNAGTLNSGSDGDDGGGVSLEGGAIFNMSGGAIVGNLAGFRGGGVFVRDSATFNMSGGKIVDNKGEHGGGVYIAGTFNMSGGAITGNNATFTGNNPAGGGVNIWSTGKSSISGNVTITGNKKGTADDNVYFDENDKFILAGDLTASSRIGISRNAMPTKGIPVVIVDNTGAHTLSADNILSDNAAYGIVKVVNDIKLAWAATVTITPGLNMTKTSGSGAATQKIVDSGSITSVAFTAAEGYYFPDNYSVTAVNGISVTRNSCTQITVSGTPTANTVAITLTAPTAKEAAATPNLTPTQPSSVGGKGSIPTTTSHEWSTNNNNWTNCTGELTNLDAGTYYVRVKATETSLASEAQTITITDYVEPTRNVTITAGSNMSNTSGSPTQTVDAGNAITSIVYTAASGYYFPSGYELPSGSNGLTVAVSADKTTITVSGTPTADVTLTLTAATAKTQPAAPTGLAVTQPTLSVATGSIATDATHEYSTDQTNWTDCNGVLSTLAAGTYYVRVKATDTTLASNSAEYTITAYVAGTYTVTINAGTGITPASGYSGNVTEGQAMTPQIFTAASGYYFPTDYSVTAVNGIGVTRNSSTQITVSGTPTANTTLTLTAATAKISTAAPTGLTVTQPTLSVATGGIATNSTHEYSTDQTSWTDCGGALTGLAPGTYYVRVKETETALASDAQAYTITALGTYTISITAGSGMTPTGTYSASVTQTDSMTEQTYTAALTYYFPTNYSVSPVNGISVTLIDFTQISVSGTPTASTTLTLTAATPKTKEATPTATYTPASADDKTVGTLSAITTGMMLSLDGGDTWSACTGTEMSLTGVNVANGIKVKTVSTDSNTRLDSDIQTITLQAQSTSSHSSSSSSTTTTTTTTTTTDNPDSSTTTDTTTTTVTKNADGTTTTKTSATGNTAAYDGSTAKTVSDSTTVSKKNADGSTTDTTTGKSTTTAQNGAKSESTISETTTTASDTNGGTTATTTATENIVSTAADGTKSTAEVKTESVTTLDANGNGTVKATSTETVKNEAGDVTATTVTESSGTVKTAADGTVTTTVNNVATTTDAQGKTEVVKTTETTIEQADGTVGSTVNDASGNTILAEAKISEEAVSEAVKSDESIVLPVEVKAESSAAEAAPVAITLPSGSKEVTVEVPVENMTDGTVAVLVKPDGTEEIIKTSTTDGDNVVLTLDSSATIKIVDNTKKFVDVKPTAWYAKDVAWAASHEVMNGIGYGYFAGDQKTNTAMVSQMLFNLDGAKVSGELITFPDVKTSDWFAPSVTWMVESGIAKGDGYSFGANIPITRERLAVMYYNYAQMKGYDTSVRGDLNQYKDAAGVSSWARDALAWAAGVGLINGAPDGLGNVYFLGQGSATRAELAAITQRFCEKVAK